LCAVASPARLSSEHSSLFVEYVAQRVFDGARNANKTNDGTG
jgi:dTDP-4-dehydrorhamnose reductase